MPRTNQKPKWKTKKIGKNVFEISEEMPTTTDWEHWCLLRSDAHHDNPDCNQDLEREHLDLAKERGASIIDNGDLFCAMQGKYDPRSNKDKIRPEHQKGDYLDALVQTASDFYAPYAENFVLLGHGNHETSIKNRYETDLTARLTERLNTQTGSKIYAGHYTSWVRFRFKRSNSNTRNSILLWRHHGYGGDAPVTKGTIQTARISPVVPDAEIVVTGHSHNEWIFPITRLRLSPRGRIYKDRQTHIKVPTYKDEYGSGAGGWAIERGMPPKPIGACWLRFSYFRRENKFVYEVQRAR